MNKSENIREVDTSLFPSTTPSSDHLEESDLASSKKFKIPKKTVNVFRTTSRNNIELTAIADNKASILLSLNALMITFITPTILANLDMVVEKMLFIPIGIFIVTCAATMYISAQVLKPSDFDKLGEQIKSGNPSPFFFGNFFEMDYDEYHEFMESSIDTKRLLTEHLIQDLYFLGKRLGDKMSMIRKAFNIFVGGVMLTLFTTLVLLIF